jgi:hypothetical protein
LIATLIAITGCQRIVPPPISSPVNNPPMVLDDATQIRNYDPSLSYYASGATVAGGTSYLWQTHETIPPGYVRFTDVPVAVLNMVCTPVGVFIESPWEAQVYRGEPVPPTYTANPPLP